MIRIVFYHVGKGDLSLVLLPQGEAMLIDCFRASEAVEGDLDIPDTVYDRIASRVWEHRMAYAEASPFERQRHLNEALLERESKKKVRLLLLAVTHVDKDHVHGRKKLREKFDIDWLMDNGRDYADPGEPQKDYLRLRKEMNDRKRYIAVTHARNGLLGVPDVGLDALCPNRAIASEEDYNNQCLILQLTHKGRQILFAGDSPVDDWVNRTYGILSLHPGRAKSDILHVSHHGSRTFFTPPGPRPAGQPDYKKEEFDTRALVTIDPTISFITCSDDENAEHPHPIALEVYRELTNQRIEAASRKSHVLLSRETSHLQVVIDDDGRIYKSTSNSCCKTSQDGPRSRIPYLTGTVSSCNGRLDSTGIWVVSDPGPVDITFMVRAKGTWSSAPDFDWRVLNNGQGRDVHRHEFYGIDSADRKRRTTWTRPLVYEGFHLMQCLATSRKEDEWARWCTGVCFESSLPYAKRWMQLFPNSFDIGVIGKG